MWILLLPFATLLGVFLGRKEKGRKPMLALPAPDAPSVSTSAPIEVAGVWVGAAQPPYPGMYPGAYGAPMRSPMSSPHAQPASPPPSPMAVLSALIASGKVPSLIVVQCAIAEASLAGRADVARAIATKFDIPMPVPGAIDPKLLALAAAPTPATATPATDAPATTDAAPAAVPAMPAMSTSAPVGDLIVSPINGVSDEAFTELANRLAREDVAFNTDKHVGAYRFARRRLAELGIDPAALLASGWDAQDAALVQDVRTIFPRLVELNLLDDLGKLVTLPDVQGDVPLSLSGLLALCSVAGVNGAMSWLRNANDRKRYPNTTITFIACNGVF